ncbi:MAG TPA: AAA family ATPase [Polyangiales bacterium]|nr:AAA family ATPase [Polyangiales bacterium]
MLERGLLASMVPPEQQQELDPLDKAQLEAALFSLATGPVWIGRFHVRRPLGRGSMGMVYEAYDSERGVPVALKLLRAQDAKAIAALKREFRSLVALSHPNLVALESLFCHQGLWFFSMELLADAVHFDAWIWSAPPGERVARLRAGLAQLVTAVDALHGAGKLHCDLKPSNVLVTAEGRVVVVDFGLVVDATCFETLQTGVVGTPAYLAPEQAQGRAPCQASDWYAVGVMLFESLTQRLPFDGAAIHVLGAKQASRAPRTRDLLQGYDPAQVAGLCELCDALLTRDPAERPGRDELRAVVANDASIAADTSAVDASAWLSRGAPFVGREPELAALRAALADMRAGVAVTALLAGRSGVGKSALLDRFVSEIDDETLVLRGRCHEHENVPYKVFDEVVAALGHRLRRLPAGELEALVPRHVQALCRLFPELGRIAAFARPGTQQAAERDPRELRNEAFAALKELLLRLTDTRPVVIVVDDLQWGDADSARMLGHVLGGLEAPPLLLLGAYRNDEAEDSELLSEVLQRTAPRVLDVEPLPPPTAELLTQQLLACEGLHEEPQLAACIAREAQGLAVFICELVRHHVESSQRRPGHALSLERALLERVATLPESAQRLLHILSVAGAPLEKRVALRAADLTPEERRASHALRAARLLRGHAGYPADALEVYHDRVREIVVGQLDAEVVRDAHARIAAALEALEVSDPERLVTHYARAGDHVRARERAIQAAETATAKLAFNRAAELLRVAIQHSAAEPERRSLQRRLGDALVSAGRGSQAAAEYLRAVDESDPRGARELQRLAAMHYLRSGRTAEGLALARKVFSEVGLRMPENGVGAVGAYVWQRARLELRSLSRGPSPAPASAQQLERLDCMLAVFPELSFSDPLPGAVLQAQFLGDALAAGEPQRLLQGLVFEVFNLSMLGGSRSRRRALTALERARELAREVDTAYARAMVNLAEASLHLWSGRSFRSVLLPCKLARQAFSEVGSEASLERGIAAFMYFTALELTGDIGELCSGALHMLREAQERDDRFVLMLTMLSVPFIYAMRGQAEEGLRLLRDHEVHFPPGFTTFREIWLIRSADMLNYLGPPRRGARRARAALVELHALVAPPHRVCRQRTARLPYAHGVDQLPRASPASAARDVGRRYALLAPDQDGVPRCRGHHARCAGV